MKDKIKTFRIVQYLECYKTYYVSAINKKGAEDLVYGGEKNSASTNYKNIKIIECEEIV